MYLQSMDSLTIVSRHYFFVKTSDEPRVFFQVGQTVDKMSRYEKAPSS